MALITWTEDLQLGIPSVDAQHQKLAEILNQLDEAKKTGKGSRVMGDLLQNLIDDAVEHFAFEEKVMLACDYPELDLHRSQHKQLVDRILNFQHQFQEGGQRVTQDVMHFLKFWLESHILKEDMAFGDFAKLPENQELISSLV